MSVTNHKESIMIKPVELTKSVARSFSLEPLAEELRQEAAYERSGRTAASLARGDDMTVVLTVVRAGELVREHEAPGPVSVIVLSGRVRFGTEEEELVLGAHEMVSFAGDVTHSVEAVEDSAFLIVIGGRSGAGPWGEVA